MPTHSLTLPTCTRCCLTNSYKQQFRRLRGLLNPDEVEPLALKGSALCYNVKTARLVSYNARQRVLSVMAADGAIQSEVRVGVGRGGDVCWCVVRYELNQPTSCVIVSVCKCVDCTCACVVLMLYVCVSFVVASATLCTIVVRVHVRVSVLHVLCRWLPMRRAQQAHPTAPCWPQQAASWWCWQQQMAHCR